MRNRSHTVSFVRAAFVAALIAALCVCAAGCAENEARASSSAKNNDKSPAPAVAVASSSATATQTPRPENVRVVELAPTSVSEIASANGVAEAVSDIVYSAELPGKIEYLPIEIGDRIRRGQVLARIDFKTLSAQAAQADIGYQLSKTTVDRLAALESEEIVSKQKMDEVRTQMASAESQRAIIRTQLAKAIVRADKPGVIANRFVERSEYVGPGTPIAQVVDLREMIVLTHLAETEIAQVKAGAQARVEFDALHETFAGVVEAIVPSASKESKTFSVRVKVKNPDERILIGMSARVRIALKELKDVIAVPQSAIIEESGGRSVYVAVNGKAQRRAVELGTVDADRVVITSGVQSGEKLIVVGHRNLADGQAITVVQ